MIQISKQTNIFINNVFKNDNNVKLIETNAYKNVINSAHKKAGMQIYGDKNE
jgi:hypothetical protein